jgi:O-methyltransferase
VPARGRLEKRAFASRDGRARGLRSIVRMSVAQATAPALLTEAPAALPPRSIVRRGLALARNLVKYRLFHDLSIRSERFGREHMVELAVRFVKSNQVDGSYLEFGVYRGSMFAQFYHTLRRHRVEAPMFGFDSFRGLPEPCGIDAAPGVRRYNAGHFVCSGPEFVREMTDRWVPRSAYTVVPGFYSESLRPALYERYPALHPAALIWIDCLFYESARDALRFVAPLIQDGTVVMCVSYFRFKARPDSGERRALNEFMIEHPHIGFTEYARFSIAGAAFIAHT